MKLKLFAILVASSFSNCLIGQQLFTAKYDFAGQNYLNSIIKQTSDSSYIFSGFYRIQGADFLPTILKADKNFNPSWMKIYSLKDTTTNNTISYQSKIIENYSKDSLFIYGFTSIWDTAGNLLFFKPYIGKLDNDGNLGIAKLIYFTDWDQITNAIATPDGGLLIAGSTKTLIFGSDYDKGNFFIVKLDAQLKQEWAKLYGDTLRSGLQAITMLPDSGFIVSGYTWQFNISTTDGDWVIMRLDKNGNVIWCKRTAVLLESQTRSNTKILIGLDSNLVVAYQAQSLITHLTDISLAKIDLNGNLLWHRSIGTNVSNTTDIYDMMQLGDSSFIIQGYHMIHVNDSGIVLDSKYLNNALIKTAATIIKTFDNKIVGVGDYRASNNSTNEMYVFTMDSIGTTACGSFPLNTHSVNTGISLTDWLIPDSSVTFYETPLAFTQFDTLPAIHYLCFLGDDEKQTDKSYFTIYPNPTQNMVTVNSSKKMQLLELYSLQGNLLMKIKTEEQAIELPIINLNEGMYLLKIYFTDGIVVRKVVKQD